MKLIWITSSSSSSWHKFFAQFLYLTIPACTFFSHRIMMKAQIYWQGEQKPHPWFQLLGHTRKKKDKKLPSPARPPLSTTTSTKLLFAYFPSLFVFVNFSLFLLQKNSHICYFYPKDPTSMTDIQTENMTGHLNVASISSRADVPTDLSFRKISLFSLTCWLSAAGEVMGNFLLRWIIPVAPWNRPALACPDGCRNQKSEGLEAFLTVWLLTVCAFS